MGSQLADAPARGGLERSLSRLYWNLHWDRFDVFVRLVEPADANFVAPGGYRFVFGEAGLRARCEQRHTELGPRDRERGARRLELGHRLVLGLTDPGGLPVFSMWVNPRNLNVPGQQKRALSPAQQFIYKAFTSPEHRGQKLYQAGMAFVLQDLCKRGQRELVGYAHTDKRSSRAGLDRLGFASVGHYRAIGYGRHLLIWNSPGLRRRFPRSVLRSGLDLT
jgi:hypothetical protein